MTVIPANSECDVETTTDTLAALMSAVRSRVLSTSSQAVFSALCSPPLLPCRAATLHSQMARVGQDPWDSSGSDIILAEAACQALEIATPPGFLWEHSKWLPIAPWTHCSEEPGANW